MDKLRITAILIIALSLLIVSTPLFPDELNLDIKQHVLENGLKVLVLERRHSPTVSAYIYYPAGGVNEVAGITGISHFIEHLMSKGTKTLCTRNYEAEVPIMEKMDALFEKILQEARKPHRDELKLNRLKAEFSELDIEHTQYIVSNEIDKIYIAAGASSMNATTSVDYTKYYVSLPKNKIELWCAIESDIMRGPVFREFYTERDVVAEERRMNFDDDPIGTLFKQLKSAAYTVHPYRNEVIGAMSDIQSFTRKTIREYYRKYYGPNRAHVIIVGDVDAKEVFALVEKYFGDIPRRSDPPDVMSVEPTQQGERRIEVEFDAEPQIGIAYHKTSVYDPDQPAFDVLSRILSSGRTSRLYRKLVEEKQIAVSVYSWAPDMRYPGLYYIFAKPRAPHTVDEIEKAIYDEIDKLKNEMVSEWELQRAKNRLTAEFIFELRSNDSLADTIGFYSSLDALDYMAAVTEKWNAVTAEDVQRVVNEYLVKSNRTVAYIVSRKRKHLPYGVKEFWK